MGFEVSLSEDGQQAVDACTREEFELVLMNCHMPVLNGFQATRAIRDTGSQVPIVALTADTIASTREVCTDAGIYTYLSKPIILGNLLSTLENCLPTTPTSAVGH